MLKENQPLLVAVEAFTVSESLEPKIINDVFRPLSFFLYLGASLAS